MSGMIKCGIRFLNIQNIKNVVSQILFSITHQRLCFHTSWILNVKGKELVMPALSPTMENGIIVKWLKKEGELINPGDAIADIQTDKAVMTLEFDDKSVFAKIIVAEGQNAKIGELIALTVETNEDWKSVEVPNIKFVASSKDALKKNKSLPVKTKSVEKIPEGQTNISMPSLSPTMATGTIVKWIKKEGDIINAGDALAEIQTDKALMTFHMNKEAILAKVLVSEGTVVEIGEFIAIIVKKDFDLSKVVIPSSMKGPSVSPLFLTSTITPTGTGINSRVIDQTSMSAHLSESDQVYGLAVKRLLEEYGLSSGSIKGTGRYNRLLKEDVLNYIQSKHIQKVMLKSEIVLSITSKKSLSQTPTSTLTWIAGPSTFTEVNVSSIQSGIARRLTESKITIPHSYVTTDICIDNLIEVCKKLKNSNINVSINDFIVKAVAHVLLECSEVNSLYENGQIISQPKVNVSIALSTPTGLMTPIVFNTASKALDEIANDIKTLSDKARQGKLQPQEFEGGTFTISNLGMFGIKSFSAIINPPQTAILAVGAGQTVTDFSFNKTAMINVTLSYNRNAINEEQAANFLAVLHALLQNPQVLATGKFHSVRHNYQ